MAIKDLARRERLACCDALEEVGPDAPTLCEGWDAADLAAHLYAREHDPLAGPGIAVPRLFGSLTDRRMGAAKKRGFERNVQSVRSGRGLFTFAPPAIDVFEFFVHTEDVRRANGHAARELDTEREDALWSWIGRLGRGFARNVSAGVRLVEPDRGERTVKPGEHVAELRGRASELTLYLAGRRANAEVEVGGDPAAVDALRRANLSI